MFEFIKDTVTELPLKEEFLSKEDLDKLKKVFYMPALGKISVPYRRYKGIWEAYLNKKAK
jgi:predicted nucleotidyltransferase